MWMTLWNLFIAFGRATMLGYGGGPSIIPLYQNEVVRMGWMSPEEFGNALAFGNALPGPIATKLAAYIGFKIAGWAGACVALAAVVMPTALLMIALVGVMVKLQNNAVIRGMIKGVQPVIFVMMAMLAYDFAKYAFKPSEGIISFMPFLLGAGYFIMVQYLNINAAWGIVASLIIGAIFFSR
ncbi:chromate transporter [Paenibacillus doosanensis]|uniref:Chromate transport protein n=1 Tax=Paenibacillus konkukensis TaxID=2020716 RepID=A0ABY4RSY1_9BACL|nr:MULTISPECIES: chromate transporter [Paenibacillus]MCS7463248.1 chromate transporter [Paenibacillus doosanensis]UQZ85218.1 putative chromate transport protein [Paenibacillus konkukensis]